MNKLIALILCFMFATPAFADGKVASIKEGQKAPYNGYLFDPTAFATIEIDKQDIIKKCDLDKDLLTKKCDGECKFLSDTCKNEKDTLDKTFKIQLDSKNNEIKRLNEIIIKEEPSIGFWFGLGAVTGIAFSLSAVYLVKKL